MDIDGKKVAEALEKALQEKVREEKAKIGIAFILVGEDAPSKTYVRMKKQACARVGIYSKEVHLPQEASQQEVIDTIDRLNQDEEIDGILVQMPLPKHINPISVVESIRPDKDVDGLHPTNIGKAMIGDPRGILPCTPLGVLKLLEAYKIDPSGKHVVVVGRSSLVGRPLANLLSQSRPYGNATVTLAHSKTENLSALCKEADILIVAIGKARFIKKSMVKKGCVVIDVGISREEGKIVGDVDYEEVKEVASYITPVPGGVGPMTIAMLLYNAASMRERRKGLASFEARSRHLF